MFTISVETHFWASHQLKLPDDSKEPEHYHNWSVAVVVSGKELNSMGLVIDFERLKKLLCDITAQFDNKKLSSIDFFRKNSPSAENIAKFIYEKLRTKLPENVILKSIRVSEEPGCSAIFTEEKSDK